MTAADRVTRVSSELFDSAALEGARQSRSAKQQLDHWTRVGRAVSERGSMSRKRVEATLAGNLPMSVLNTEERVVVNAEIDARIQESLRGTDYGAVLAAGGVTTVALDAEGNLVEHRPDGTTALVGHLN